MGRNGFSFTTNKPAAEAYSAGFSKGEEAVQWWAHEVNKILRTIPEDSDAEAWGSPATETEWDTGAMDIDQQSISEILENIKELADEIRNEEPEVAGKLDQLSLKKPQKTTGGKLYGVFLKLNNPRTVEASESSMAEDLVGVRASEESDVIVKLGNGDTLYFVHSPSSIKSADPFTGVPLDKRFNPESDSILNASPLGQNVDENIELESKNDGWQKTSPLSERNFDIDSPRSLKLSLEPWNEQSESQRPASGSDPRIAAGAIRSFRNALGPSSNLRFFTLAERASGQDGLRGDRLRLSNSLVKTIDAFESAFGKRVVFFEADSYDNPPPRGGLHPSLTPNYIAINADKIGRAHV